MKIPNELATHEAGHLVVGLRIGMDEQGILFGTLRPDEAGGAVCKHLDSDQKKAIIRSFAGLLAHIHLLPNSIAPDLRRAYMHSIIVEPNHPNFHEIAHEDRDFLSGAKTDIRMAWSFAMRLNHDNQKQSLSYLRSVEHKTRSLIVECAPNISRVVDDIHLWSAEPDRESEYMKRMSLYSSHRAKAVIQKN
jgi:hypothetical protein